MDIFEEVYGTQEKLASADETAAYEEIYDTLVKVAAANDLDLSDLSDDDIVEIISELVAEEGETKEASADEASADEVTEDDIIKVAEADFLGRTIAHSMIDELTKMAAEEDAFDPVADRAEEILRAAASQLPDEEEKVASDEDALNAAALEYLDNEGYDVETIVGLLGGE